MIETKLLTPAEVLALIPKVDAVDQAFPAGPAITGPYDALTPHAVAWREAASYEERWGVRFCEQVFFSGGKCPQPNAEFTAEDIARVYAWVIAAMRSHYPKHEHKEAVCGMLWSMFFLQPETAGQPAPGKRGSP